MLNNHRVFTFLVLLALAGGVSVGGCGSGDTSVGSSGGPTDIPVSGVFSLDLMGGGRRENDTQRL